MFARFAQSWSLIKASASVLRSDKELLLFPLLSAIASMVVAASFIVPAVLGGAVTTLGDGGHVSPTLYLGLFAFYVVQYFVIIFFNTALVGAAMIRLRGGDPTVADGFRIALSKLPAILGYAVISATVGVLLRALQERAGFIGRYVVGLIGLAWTVASFLVVPVLANHDVGPIDAVKRSAELLKKTWGENLIGNTGIGLVFGFIVFATVLVGGGLIVLAATTKTVALIVAAALLVGVAVLMLVLVQAALQGIYSAALYRYAAEGDAGSAFQSALVADAFRVKA
ncbi:DUF6159 family protein [Dokdonella sp.]|uniref:DUF6159 family protein n=1 Tax=Dokdonella sp. TaxID=2291710 RepID=UPI0025C0D708|nr:DUF6159 family protein [Dokdonella sp.]MBX3691826.1 hypothetical protein [Dokdonella sp.]MCW5569257.1 hypothetical protein [Dokdonella sp.]